MTSHSIGGRSGEEGAGCIVNSQQGSPQCLTLRRSISPMFQSSAVCRTCPWVLYCKSPRPACRRQRVRTRHRWFTVTNPNLQRRCLRSGHSRWAVGGGICHGRRTRVPARSQHHQTGRDCRCRPRSAWTGGSPVGRGRRLSGGSPRRASYLVYDGSACHRPTAITGWLSPSGRRASWHRVKCFGAILPGACNRGPHRCLTTTIPGAGPHIRRLLGPRNDHGYQSHGSRRLPRHLHSRAEP
jgi:hypothetical protein